MSGELLAEYAANASYTMPQKEYGYRNGQLLITAEGGTARANFALRSNGATASASSDLSSSCSTWPARGTIDGDRKGTYWSNGGGWADATSGSFNNDWLQIDFDNSKTIDEIDVFTVQDNYANPAEPTEAMTFSAYGLTQYAVQYWDGSSWLSVPGASVSGNNKVWRKFTFSAISTSKIRVLPQAAVDNGYSRLTEVEAWGPSAPAKTNVALRSNGGTTSASSELTSSCSSWPARGANDGDRKGAYWGNSGGWADNTSGTFPDWLQIDFNGSKSIDEIDVITVQDNYSSPSEPTETMTFSSYGLTGYEVQYWNGSAWVTVSGGSISGNNKIWRKITFAAITTTKIRVLANAAVDNGYSRIAEVEAWTAATGGGSSSSNINWLVTDQLGTPRMVFDKTGTLANVKRHDYLPFGEELFAGTGGRTTAQGYSAADGVRQKFTQKERDNETGLDYFGARYYASTEGRFTSPDPLLASGRPSLPQSWNRYGYVLNNPLRLIDPNGLSDDDPQEKKDEKQQGQKIVPCSQVTIEATVDQNPTMVENQTITVNGQPVKATGVEGTIVFTVKVNGQPTGDVQVTETNETTTTRNGNPVPSPTAGGPTTRTNPDGQFQDTVGLKRPTDGTETRNNEIKSDYSKNTWTLTNNQTLNLALPGGNTCSGTNTRTLTNKSPKGPSSKYKLTTTQPVVKPDN